MSDASHYMQVVCPKCGNAADHMLLCANPKCVAFRQAVETPKWLADDLAQLRSDLEAARKQCEFMGVEAAKTIRELNDGLTKAESDLAALRSLAVKKDEGLNRIMEMESECDVQDTMNAFNEASNLCEDLIALTPSSLRDHVCVPRGEWERLTCVSANLAHADEKIGELQGYVVKLTEELRVAKEVLSNIETICTSPALRACKWKEWQKELDACPFPHEPPLSRVKFIGGVLCLTTLSCVRQEADLASLRARVAQLEGR